MSEFLTMHNGGRVSPGLHHNSPVSRLFEADADKGDNDGDKYDESDNPTDDCSG